MADNLAFERRRDIAVGAVAEAAAAPKTAPAPAPGENALDVSFKVNGQPCALELDPRTTLLDALREHLGLTGTKKGCDLGQCGACTVLVEGRRINSCLTLAVMHEGADDHHHRGARPTGEHLHPMQEAFVATTVFNAAIARPARSARRWRCAKKSAGGFPATSPPT